MQAQRSKFLLLVAFSCFSVFGLGSLAAQSRGSFKVTGPCLTCGSERILNIVNALDGVKSSEYDLASNTLTVQYDAVSASLIDIQLELSLQGYDAGDFSRDKNADLPACAKNSTAMRGEMETDDLPEPGIDDLEDEGDTDWEKPNSFEIIGNASDDFDDVDLLDEDLDDSEDLLEWASDSNNGSDLESDTDDDDDDDDDE